MLYSDLKTPALTAADALTAHEAFPRELVDQVANRRLVQTHSFGEIAHLDAGTRVNFS